MSGRPPYDGSIWQGDQGEGYDDQGYHGRGYDDRGYDDRGYAQPNPRPAGPDGQRYRPQQYPPGYDRRAAPPRRLNANYDRPGYDQPGNYGDQGDDSFLPGFGRRDDLEGGRPGDPGRGNADPRAPRGADPRGRDGRGPGGPGGRGPGGPGGPGGRGPDGRGFDPRDHDPRDPRGNQDWDTGRDPRPRRRKSVMRRLAPWIALLVIIAPLAYGGVYVYGRYKDKYHPADYVGAGSGPTVMVQVQSGEDASGLAPTLVEQGVVASARAFVIAAEASTNAAGLEPGFYTLKHHMQASVAYAALVNPKNRVQTTVTIPEGKRASQIALILAQQTKLPVQDFTQLIAHPPASLGLPEYAHGKVEGYLFPATYAIVPHETALQILQAMVQRFTVEADQVNLAAAAQQVGLTAGQVIIDASMAQAEGGSDADFPKIAEVINNRIKAGMHLDFDSTVVYGLGKYSVSATFAELKINTPYNTYLHAGRPAGPISNPGDAAIQAILHPDKGDYLYFLTKPGGASQFSHTCLPGQC